MGSEGEGPCGELLAAPLGFSSGRGAALLGSTSRVHRQYKHFVRWFGGWWLQALLVLLLGFLSSVQAVKLLFGNICRLRVKLQF